MDRYPYNSTLYYLGLRVHLRILAHISHTAFSACQLERKQSEKMEIQQTLLQHTTIATLFYHFLTIIWAQLESSFIFMDSTLQEISNDIRSPDEEVIKEGVKDTKVGKYDEA